MGIFTSLASLTGYLLNFLYNIVNNYGLAIILFSIITKALLVPLSISQQRSMQKTAKVQDKIKQIQEKYKNDNEKAQKEILELYKREKINPAGGCFTAIIQLILLIAIFMLVKNPLTYMKKIDTTVIEGYKNTISQENNEKNNPYVEIEIIKRFSVEKEEININMNFLGIDLKSIPMDSLNDYRVYIIPVLYIISSILSMKIATKTQPGMQLKKKEENGEEVQAVEDPMAQANKSMNYMMPFIATTVAMTTPLGLGLYWLTNNILMTIEKIALNKYLNNEKEVEEDVK